MKNRVGRPFTRRAFRGVHPAEPRAQRFLEFHTFPSGLGRSWSREVLRFARGGPFSRYSPVRCLRRWPRCIARSGCRPTP